MAEKDINILNQINELRKRGLLSQRIVIIKGPAMNGAPVVEKREESILDDEGLKEITISELSYAPACHHLIHTEEELGGVCIVCGQAMCKVCSANNLCALCGRTVCKKDQKQIEDIGMVCVFCKRDWLIKKIISFLITAGITGAIILFVLRFIQ